MTTLDRIAEAQATLVAATQAAQADADALQAAETVLLEQRDTIAELDGQVAAQAAQIADYTEVIRQWDLMIQEQADRIAELEALLNGGGEEPAPTMLVGASVQRRTGETWPTALARFEATIGKPVQIVRRYISGRPPANPATHSSLADVLDGRYPALALSFVDGTVAEIVTFLQGLPATGTTYYVAIRHEPDKDLRMSGPAFQAKCDDLIAAIDQVGRDDVEPMFVLMSWLERDGRADTSSLDYMPRTNLDRWVMALDPYLGRAQNTYATQAGPTIAVWRNLGGKRIAIAEWGIKTTGQEAADQLARFMNDAKADGCEFACYFDSAEGENAGAGWFLDARGPQAVAAFAAALP